ncbi:MAG: hypothetical protein DRO46_03610, partial [Candidatus Hecatellales archaeon]
MIPTYDVGSMPLTGDVQAFTKGLRDFQAGEESPATSYFKDKIVGAFADKIEAGISLPNYPQFRDMNQMFLEVFEGLVKVGEAYVAESFSLKRGMKEIPEVRVLRVEAGRVFERLSYPPERLKVKICITGPYTLASL